MHLNSHKSPESKAPVPDPKTSESSAPAEPRIRRMWYEYRLIPVENSVPALEKAVNLQAQQETGENTGFQLKTIIASGTKLIAVMEASRLEYEPELEKEVKFEQTA